MMKKEEEALPRRDDVRAYWAAHKYRSSADEFFDYYEAHHWVNARGLFIRCWKRAAVMWEDKFRRDVLPVRRREAIAEARVENDRRHQEAEQMRRNIRQEREAEEDRRASRAVGQEQGTYMYRRAVMLCNGDEDRAIDLVRRASDDAALFRRLCEGFRQSPPRSDGQRVS